MSIRLQVIEGPHKDKFFDFRSHDLFLVGRSTRAHFSLPASDPFISRFHFVLELNDPLCRLVDLDSRNGTFVNGQKIQVADLFHGDEIRIGQTLFRLDTSLKTPASHLQWNQAAQAAQAAMSKSQPDSGALAAHHSASKTGASDAAQPTLPPDPVTLNDSTIETLLQLQSMYWIHDCPLSIERMIDRWPFLATNSEYLVDLMYNEFVQREKRGDSPNAEEYAQRFPQVRTAWMRQIEFHAAFQSTMMGMDTSTIPDHPHKQFPAVPGYRILREEPSANSNVRRYLATNSSNNHPVSILLITPVGKIPRERVVSTLQRIAAYRQIQHPNLLALLGVMQLEQRIALIRETVPNPLSVARLISRDGPLPPSVAVAWTLPILQALSIAHVLDLPHGGITLDQLLFANGDPRNPLLLAEFGLFPILELTHSSGMSTLDGETIHRNLIAPECIHRFTERTPEMDQYAIASCLYEMICGQPVTPRDGPLNAQLLQMIQSDPLPLAQRVSRIPVGLSDSIMRALSRHPEHRYRTIGDFLRALEPFADAVADDSVVPVTTSGRPLGYSSVNPTDPIPPQPTEKPSGNR
ncbi:FHA domain-containing protein [Tuwongella immobilis]|uniref:FHA domain-containing protein n=1 Tax=Tuwongella immobilis TaxID=692036 RepID=A0A6C2YJV2_9BACT|nr:FHA domain-containing protein [Tuwongella immobilis]VIP01696.1 serine threonine protein kinase : Serine/threonine protein kinase with FHA domain protein OS=Isosphaera pallida (strain ATCC 43644 / DSM 9630 / IS1B) GN=Isop_2049 PE=3 SV=1: FHA: Pkinase [Tuwongella immobilis]VTR99176.1 serine threonine protein kinase : Serine/threonine protein kinase with FHA domain protein OS=Isosphaera pallida (strain ATCC 43644 / DSM 9630 / IS1B) GN=Isop_2049 PE=3 SV=1: FHA: Pkinase [Tuwongella immobilis]